MLSGLWCSSFEDLRCTCEGSGESLLKVTQEYDPQSWLFFATETNVGTWSYLPKHVPKRPAFRMTLPFKGLCDFKCSIAYPCDWFQLHQSPITMLNKGNAHCATVAFTDRDNSSEGRACLTPLSVRRDVAAILGRSLWTYPSKVVMLSFPSRPSRVASWRAVFLNLFVGGKILGKCLVSSGKWKGTKLRSSGSVAGAFSCWVILLALILVC